jgi:hypothetical protein
MNPNDPRQPPYGYGPQQQQQQWAPQQYPPNPYPYYPPPVVPYETPQNDSEATTIFVLGIVGVTACGLCAPIAWAKGASYRKTCLVLGQPPNGLATAGWIMGIIGTILIGISLAFMVLAIAIS